MTLDGKIAVVTGGASGIGAAITRVLVQRGARVVLVDTNEQAGQGMVDELGDRVRFVAGDVSDRAIADRAVELAAAEFGGLNVLVNNAHASRVAPFAEQTEEYWDLSLNTGLRATRNFMLAAHSKLAENGGSVVNFASGAGLEGQRNQASYAATKEAIRGLSRVVANEWAAEDIRVNVVSPMAHTAGVEQWAQANPEQFAASKEKVPMGRFGDPERDVAPVVAFLASDDSRYMTGQTLMADGGATKLR